MVLGHGACNIKQSLQLLKLKTGPWQLATAAPIYFCIKVQVL